MGEKLRQGDVVVVCEGMSREEAEEAYTSRPGWEWCNIDSEAVGQAGIVRYVYEGGATVLANAGPFGVQMVDFPRHLLTLVMRDGRFVDAEGRIVVAGGAIREEQEGRNG